MAVGRSDCTVGAGSPLDTVLGVNESRGITWYKRKNLFLRKVKKRNSLGERKRLEQAKAYQRKSYIICCSHSVRHKLIFKEEGKALPTHHCWVTVSSKCPVSDGTQHVCGFHSKRCSDVWRFPCSPLQPSQLREHHSALFTRWPSRAQVTEALNTRPSLLWANAKSDLQPQHPPGARRS